MRNEILSACMTAAAFGAGGFAPFAIAQPDRAVEQEREREVERRREEAERVAQERARDRAEAARDREEAERDRASLAEDLERARADMERAARDVARLSAEWAAPLQNINKQVWLAVRRPTLGINPEDTELGVRVAGVSPNGPAAEADIEIGDVIVSIDGTSLTDPRVTGRGKQSPTELLVAQLEKVEPGADVRLKVSRDGRERDVSVDTRPGFAYQNALPRLPRPPRWPAPFFVDNAWSDMELVTLTPELGSYFGAQKGLLVVRGPENDALGLRDGDVILDIGGREPTSPEHAVRILASFEDGETLRINIMRRQQRQTLEIEVPEASALE